MSILAKGLSFIPKPKKLDLKELLRDVDDFIYKIRMRYMLRGKPMAPRPSFVRKKVNPTLLTCHHARLDGILDHLKETIGELGSSYSQAQWDNLTRAERRAITELKDNPELVINKADKGSTVVIRDRSDYCNKAYIDLSNTDVYLPLSRDITHDLKQGIMLRLEKLHNNGLISKEMLDYCTPSKDPRTARLYYLTKIHKKSP